MSLHEDAVRVIKEHTLPKDPNDARDLEVEAVRRYAKGYGLDVGCGATKLFANSLGTDIAGKNRPMFCMEGGKSVADLSCDAEHLPFTNEVFDFSVTSNLLEHVPNPSQVVAEMARVTKQGKPIILIVPLGDHHNPTHLHIFNKDSTVLLVQLNELDIVQFDRINTVWKPHQDYSTELVATKHSKRTEPEYSIIVPAWNQLECLVECVEHIRRFTPESHELIIVDDGSVDGVGEYGREVADKYLYSKANRGVAHSWNTGIRASEGKYIAIMNSDAYVYSGWLSDLREALEQPAIAFASGTALTEPHTEEHARELRKQAFDSPFHEGFSGCLFLTRKTVFDSLGSFDERYGFGMFEDWDMWRRAKALNMKLIATRKCQVHHVGNASWGRHWDCHQQYAHNKRLYEGEVSG